MFGGEKRLMQLILFFKKEKKKFFLSRAEVMVWAFAQRRSWTAMTFGPLFYVMNDPQLQQN